VRPPEFFVYEKIVRSRIKEAWRWYDTNTTLITQVAFEIDPDGRTTGVRITQSSGNSSFDDSVVRAVIKASPLPPPPESVYQFFKSVRVTFDPRD
jgi:colicin import membrane protein